MPPIRLHLEILFVPTKISDRRWCGYLREIECSTGKRPLTADEIKERLQPWANKQIKLDGWAAATIGEITKTNAKIVHTGSPRSVKFEQIIEAEKRIRAALKKRVQPDFKRPTRIPESQYAPMLAELLKRDELGLLHSDDSNSAAVRPRIPTPSDLNDPPKRTKATVSRIIRDTDLSREIKSLHEYMCQICGETIKLCDGTRYAEAHHIQPLGSPHDGPDVGGNILCVCPNHHAELDYGARPIKLRSLRQCDGHLVENRYVEYHNREIHRADST